MIRRQCLMFLLIGSLTVLLDFLVYRSLTGLSLVNTHVAKGMSFVVGMGFAYGANRTWTFGGEAHAPGTTWRFALLYGSTLATNIGVNAAMRYGLMSFGTTLASNMAFLVATGCSAALNFAGMKWIVFRPLATPGSS